MRQKWRDEGQAKQPQINQIDKQSGKYLEKCSKEPQALAKEYNHQRNFCRVSCMYNIEFDESQNALIFTYFYQ